MDDETRPETQYVGVEGVDDRANQLQKELADAGWAVVTESYSEEWGRYKIGLKYKDNEEGSSEVMGEGTTRADALTAAKVVLRSQGRLD